MLGRASRSLARAADPPWLASLAGGFPESRALRSRQSRGVSRTSERRSSCDRAQSLQRAAQASRAIVVSGSFAVVSRKERRAAEATGMTVQRQPSYQGAIRGTVTYGVAGAPTTIKLPQLQFIHAERTFPADCAAARVRLESPELHFAQVNPFDDKHIVRALIVRFSRHRFVERATANELFRTDLEQKLTAETAETAGHFAKRRPGFFTSLFQAAHFVGEPRTGIVEAEFDLISYSGGRAGMVVLATSQNQLASALIARAEELFFEPVVEVTMTTALLADLLLSWKTVAESIK